jgi:hypothetical protein
MLGRAEFLLFGHGEIESLLGQISDVFRPATLSEGKKSSFFRKKMAFPG